jgi:hypothetical protein
VWKSQKRNARGRSAVSAIFSYLIFANRPSLEYLGQIELAETAANLFSFTTAPPANVAARFSAPEPYASHPEISRMHRNF